MTIRNPGLVGAASSVFAASGEFRWGATDLAWKDPSIALALVRVYRSGSAYVGALGAGWQHQYEQRILVAPGTAEYRDGRLNSIIFTSVQGAWTPPAGVYLRLDYDAPNDEYVVEQRGRVFLRFENAGPGDYRLRAISPPSGRGIEIAYDVSGRIEMVTDWRGRELSFAYGAGNLLSGVSDGTGRAVQFEYDGGVLARVRGPATAAFPLGIVTLYEYVGGKLAVIRDGLDRPFLVNQYDGSGRVATQRFGEATQVFAFTYGTGVTTELDRAGNVTDYDLSASGQIVRKTLHTRGLRPTDPATYVTEYSYNAQFERTLVRFPGGQELGFVYDDANPDPCGRGNLLQVTRTPAGGGAPLVFSVTYEARYQQPKVATSWDGTVTTYFYDYEEATLGDLNGDGVTTQDRGNLVLVRYPDVTVGPSAPQQSSLVLVYDASGQLVRMTDAEGVATQYAYYAAPHPNAGMLQSEVLDPAGLAISRAFTYDARGNPSSLTDGCGNTSTFEFNELDQLVRALSPAPQLYEFLVDYDANGQVLRVRHENRDWQGQRDPAVPYAMSEFAYDLLGNLVAERRLKAPGTFVTTEFAYDANENCVEVRSPTGNVTRIDYDERNLVWRTTPAYGTPSAGTYERSYTLTGQPAELRTPLGRVTTFTYDGLGRPILATQPSGTRTRTWYDDSDRCVKRVRETAAGVAVWQTEWSIDERGRIWKTEGTDETSQGQPIGTGVRTFLTAYDRMHRITALIGPTGATFTRFFDAAGRNWKEVDQLGETLGTYVVRQFLPCGPVTRIANHMYDQRTQSLVVRETAFEYDALQRRIRTIRDAVPGGENLITQQAYDSFGRPARTQRPDGTVTERAYDALGRLVAISTQNSGAGPVVIAQEWDDDDDRVAEIDANGNRTTYEYSPRGQLVRTVRPLGGELVLQYDTDGAPTAVSDANGSSVAITYDAAGRVSQRQVTPGAGVGGPTLETRAYDGIDRLTEVALHDGATLSSRVTVAYDSFSRVDREEVLVPGAPAAVVGRTFDPLGNRARIDYPTGLSVDYAYDACGRMTSASVGATVVAQYAFCGADPVAVTYDNGLRIEIVRDGLGRETERTVRVVSTGAVVAGTRSFYDVGGHRVAYQRLGTSTGCAMRYDALGQLTGAKYGVPNAEIVANKPYADYLTFDREVTYAYDDVGNRMSVADNGAVTLYNHVGAQYVPDSENRITSVGASDREFDANGNLRDDGERTFLYDYRNRLLEVREKATSALIRRSRYDGLGRRVAAERGVDAWRIGYDGSRAIATLHAVPADDREFVYGWTLDEVVAVRGGTSSQVHCHQDSLGSVIAVTSSSGAVVERVTYDWFGAPTFLDPATSATSNESSFGVPVAFAGVQWEPDTGLYYMRARHYDPEIGSFLVQDPARNATTMDWRFGTYGYSENDPSGKIDPHGLWDKDTHHQDTMDAVKEVTSEEQENLDGKTIADCNRAMDDGFWQHVSFGSDEAQHKHGMRSYEGTQAYLAKQAEEVSEAAESCDWQKLLCKMGETLHTAQDSYAHGYMDKLEHYLIGYTGEVLYHIPLLSKLAALIGWTNPDNVNSNAENHAESKRITKQYIQDILKWLAENYPDKKAKYTGKTVTTVDSEGQTHEYDPSYCYWHIDLPSVSQEGGEMHLATYGFSLRNGKLASPAAHGMSGVRGEVAPWTGGVHVLTPAIGGFGGVGLRKWEQWGLQTDLSFLPSYRYEFQFSRLPMEAYSRDAWETNTQLR